MEAITVIIPCYNCADTVEQTVDSILSQQCNARVEVVLVNDGSTDSTHDILEGLSHDHNEVSVKHLQASSGRPSIPRNVGLDMTQGEFVCFMDADDIMPQGYLDAARKVIRSSCEFSGSLKYPFTDHTPPDRECMVGIRALKVPNLLEYSKNLFTTSGLLIPRELIGDMRFENIYLEDWRFLIRLYQRGGHGWLLLSPRVFYRVHAKSLTPKKKTLQVRRVYRVLWEVHGWLVAPILYAGYFLVGACKIAIESRQAQRIFKY